MVEFLMRNVPIFNEFETRDAAADYAVKLMLGALEVAIEDRGCASLMVSGGSTPGPIFDRLRKTPLSWDRVTVGLVDERWVEPAHDASNERLVRERLLRGHAGAAGLIPMKTSAESADAAAADRSAAYGPHCNPIDLVMLGMGNDGHTASWFPGSSGLETAFSHPSNQAVTAIDATGCEVAGAYTERLTLTGDAVATANCAVLVLFGDEKKAVYEAALTADKFEMPVRHAVDLIGSKLTVIWAP